MKNHFENFHSIYSMSKTLRFELIPQGSTEKFIEKIINDDERKFESYKKVKIYLDELHKEFIDNSLRGFKLPSEKLEQIHGIFQNMQVDSEIEQHFEKIQEELRKNIIKHFKSDNAVKGLFGEGVIDMLKSKFGSDAEALSFISEFDRFTTYFTGYNQNRQNVYEQKIPERLINENLPKHLKNVQTYTSIKKKLSEEFSNISQEFEVDMERIFSVYHFNNILTQSGIDSYNELIGGIENNGHKIKGLNEYVNEYNQTHKEEASLPKFKLLYKQILSDKSSNSFRYDVIESKNQLIEEIDSYYDELNRNVLETEELLILFKGLINYDLSRIYIGGSYLNNLSNKVYGNWEFILSKIKEKFPKEMEKTIKALESEDTDKRKNKFISFEKLRQSLSDEDFEKLTHYFQMKDFELIKQAHENYILNKENINNIKKLLDAIKDLQLFIRGFVTDDNVDTDPLFYNILQDQYDVLQKIIPLYNKARNFATKKPYSLEKFKLNFNCRTLLNGWDVNKEKDNLTILLRKDGSYYLGIFNSNEKQAVSDVLEETVENQNSYEKMDYKLLQRANEMLPKVFFSRKGLETFQPPAELLEEYYMGRHKKGELFDINFCHELIDFFKSSINRREDWSKFNFHFSSTESYEDISDFYREVENQGYKVTFRNISAENVDKLVEEGKLYLFKIYNKDFSKYSHSTPNLHTMYWRALFDEENLQNVIYKLNGEAEMFFRKKSIEKIIKHKANEPILCRREDKYSEFAYDLIKDKRFTVDKFQFHVPITLNFKANGRNNINDMVKEYIKNSDDISVIGVDRGERNLLYYSLIDSKGNLKEQGCLDVIGDKFLTNYHNLLDIKEKQRKEAREDWQEIGKIKELKTGYLSQAIHKITELMIKHNAVIVLENLNSGFKRSRTKIEKQVYQKFERMLIEKLNYLVIKNKKEKTEVGGILKAYQLTSKFESFEKLGTQSGFLFYIPAWMTSQIDPTTGFVSLFNVKYENIEKSKQFIEKFKEIKFNERENYFEFEIDDYKKFTDRKIGNKKNWIVCSYKDRIIHSKINGKWVTERRNITSDFLELFRKYQIRLNCIKEDALSIPDADFFKLFLKLFKYTVQMRNSDNEEDYIISPIKNKNGKFFDSREGDNSLPTDADANGAYNIARKGLMLLKQIRRNEKPKITNEEWLNFAQNFNND